MARYGKVSQGIAGQNNGRERESRHKRAALLAGVGVEGKVSIEHGTDTQTTTQTTTDTDPSLTLAGLLP